MIDMTLPPLPGGPALLLRWLAEPGAALNAGAPLLIVRTAVAEVALPAPGAGELVEVLVAAGQRAEGGQILARLRPPAQAESAARAPTRPARRWISPLARSIARAYGIDPAGLGGSGPDRRVLAADVRAKIAEQGAADAAQPSMPQVQAAVHVQPPVAHDRVPPEPGRQAPLASATLEFDAGAALALCAAQAAELGRRGLQVDLAACVAAATAALLPRHRALNAGWSDAGLLLRRRIHLAVARSTAAGLAWSLIHDAGDLTLRGVARALAAPPGADDLGAASFALVSAEEAAPWFIAQPPLVHTVASLCLGPHTSRPVVCGEAVAIRPIALLTLCYDARALDHTQAAAFLRDLRASLERL